MSHANSNLDKARDHVQEAIRSLSQIVVDEIEGTQNFGRDFKDELKKCLFELIDIRTRL